MRLYAKRIKKTDVLIIKMIIQKVNKDGSPLIFVCGEESTLISDWQGWKPSECWITNGISKVKGNAYVEAQWNIGMFTYSDSGVRGSNPGKG